MKLSIQQTKRSVSNSDIDRIKHWVVVSKRTNQNNNQIFPCFELIQNRRKQLGLKDNDKDIVEMDLPNDQHSHLTHANIEALISSFELLSLARKIIKSHLDYKPSSIAIVTVGFDEQYQERVIESVIAAIAAANAEMPEYKKQKNTHKPVKTIKVFGFQVRHGYKRTLAEAEGNAVARYLSMLPPNILTPGDYLKRIKKLARENKFKLEFYGEKELKKKKAGAFLAVAQGSPVADAGIIRLRYQPSKPSKQKKLILVGKGICYDTGGTNLKPAKYMFGMHEDMQGSAVAFGTFLALTRMNVNFPVECWMALAMNHIGPRAYKPNDIVTACDGTNIEVVHTDAEGRMILSDTLVMASNTKPGLIIDYATLTGACVYSLGTSYSGVFTNQDKYISTLIEAGRDSGERVWPFPIDEDYDEAIKSDIADVKQCALEGNADHILASRFLQRFVKHDTPWIHVDLSSSNRKGGLAHIPTDTTGFGVRFTLNLLLDQKLI